MNHRCAFTLRKRCALLLALFVIGIAGSARAGTAVASFEDGNRAFSQDRFEDAAARFESLLRAHGFSVPLLYDLANSYARAGHVGRAVLNYRRAQLLAPRDREVAVNLATTRAASGLAAPLVPRFRALAQLLPAATWTWLGAGGLWLAAAALGVGALRRQWRRWLVPVAAAALLAVVPCAVAAGVLHKALHEGVIIADQGASLRLAPFDTAAVEATLGSGAEVEMMENHGDFVRVRDGQGHTGWLDSKLVECLVPR